MATSNFYKVDSRHYYMVFDETALIEEEDFIDAVEDLDILKDDYKNYITEQVQELVSKDFYSTEKNSNIVRYLDVFEHNNYINKAELRSYPSTYLLTVCRELDNSVVINLDIILTSGYYSNMVLDYVIDIDYGDLDYKGPTEEQSKEIDQQVEKVRDIVEVWLKFLSFEVLKPLGTFSNGETIYTKYKD